MKTLKRVLLNDFMLRKILLMIKSQGNADFLGLNEVKKHSHVYFYFLHNYHHQQLSPFSMI